MPQKRLHSRVCQSRTRFASCALEGFAVRTRRHPFVFSFSPCLPFNGCLLSYIVALCCCHMCWRRRIRSSGIAIAIGFLALAAYSTNGRGEDFNVVVRTTLHFMVKACKQKALRTRKRTVATRYAFSSYFRTLSPLNLRNARAVIKDELLLCLSLKTSTRGEHFKRDNRVSITLGETKRSSTTEKIR